MSRPLAALKADAHERRGTPLLVVASADVVGLFAAAAPSGTAAVHVDGGAVEASLSAGFPGFTTPMTAALVSGVFGPFAMQDAPALARWLPGHHHLSVTTQAAFAGTVDLAAVGWSPSSLVVVGAVATAASHRQVRAGA